MLFLYCLQISPLLSVGDISSQLQFSCNGHRCLSSVCLLGWVPPKHLRCNFQKYCREYSGYFFQNCLFLYLFLWFCLISSICIVQILSVVCWNMPICNTNTWETDRGSLQVQGQPALHSKAMRGGGAGIGKDWENRYYLLSFIVS